MPDYDDDRRDDRDDNFDDHDRGYDDRSGRSDRVIERAKGKVSTPATLMVLSGIISGLFAVGLLGLAVAAPTVLYDFYLDMVKKQPAGPERDRLVKQVESQKDQMTMNNPMNLGQYGVSLVFNLVTVFAGMKMKGLKSYGLCLTGSIIALVPCSGCCCLTTPVGLWALIVLVNSDVKTGFQAMARRNG